GPGYSFFLAGLLALFGGSLPAVWIVQSAMGAALCCALALLTAKHFGPSAGLAAGLLAAALGPLVWIDVSLYAESLLILLLLLSALAAGFLRPPWLAATAAGIGLGLATDVRPTALVFAPALLIWLAGRPWPGRRAFGLALFAAGLLLPIVPVAVATRRATGSLLFVQSHGGMNFYLGNSPSGSGVASARPGSDWDALEGEALREGHRSAADQDRYYLRKTLNEIRSRPAAYAALLGRKLFWTFQSDEIRDTHSFAFFRATVPLLALLPGFGLVFALAVPALIVALRRRPRPWPLLAAVAGLAAGCVFLVVGTRYRLPLTAFLVPFAGWSVGRGIEALRARAWRPLAAAAIAALATLGFSHLERHAPSHVLAEEWFYTGQALLEENRSADAEAAFRRALSENAAFGPALDGLGVVAAERDALPEAERFFRASLDQGGESQRARYHLGLLLQREGRQAEAGDQFRKAVALRPNDPLSLQALAQTELASGDAASAEKNFRRILELFPNHAAAHRGLARIAWGRRERDLAIREAAEATRLDPENPEGWTLLAMLRLEAGDAAGAEPAVRRARELGPQSPPAELAAAMLARLRGNRLEADAILRPLVAAAPAYAPATRLFLQNAAELGQLPEAERYVESVRAGAPPARR
ncbi:MAG TPA: tetratricopeptide repeat protein, partial [Thermoanaerobaculia bacterium]|nr:tetratricopeptide repeat protein [Thermoanaerobaculia bacterium]